MDDGDRGDGTAYRSKVLVNLLGFTKLESLPRE